METSGSLPKLFAGVLVTDEEAAAEIFRRFAQRLIALARSRTAHWLKGRIEPEDVMQSVFRSFFRRQAAGEFEIDSWDGLWGLLAQCTVCKCLNRIQYLRAARRDVRREVAFADVNRAFDAEPTAVECAILHETTSAMLAGFEPKDRAVIEMILQGYQAREISEQLEVSERTIGRIRQRARQHLVALLAIDMA